MNNSEIFLLSLINQSPRYGYEIAQFLEESNAGLWLNISMPYVYRLLKHFSEQGWVVSQLMESDGHRPHKNVYQITEKGSSVLEHALSEGKFSLERTFFPIDVVLAVYAINGKNLNIQRLIEKQIERTKEELGQFHLDDVPKSELSVEASIAVMIIEHRIQFFKSELEWLYKVKSLFSEDNLE